MNITRTGKKVSFDVRSVMDILYGEGAANTDGAFICANDGKRRAQDGEVIYLSDEEEDYSTFWIK